MLAVVLNAGQAWFDPWYPLLVRYLILALLSSVRVTSDSVRSVRWYGRYGGKWSRLPSALRTKVGKD